MDKKVWNLAMKKCNPDFFQKQLDTCSRAEDKKGHAISWKIHGFRGMPHDIIVQHVSLKIVDGILLCKIKYLGHDILFFLAAALKNLAGHKLSVPCDYLFFGNAPKRQESFKLAMQVLL